MLSLCDAPPLVGRADHTGKDGRVARGQFLLDLEKQWMVRAVPEREDGVVARPHASGPDHFEGDVDETIRVEDELPVVAHGVAIRLQRADDAPRPARFE